MEARAHHTFNRDLDFWTTARTLAARIATERRKALDHAAYLTIDPTAVIRLKYVEMLTTEIYTGTRAGEVFFAFAHWLRTGEREIETKILKQSPVCTCGHRKTSTSKEDGGAKGHKVLGPGQRGACLHLRCPCQIYTADESRRNMRTVVIPTEILQTDRDLINAWDLKPAKLNAYEEFVRNVVQINSHAARYLFLGYADSQGMTVAQISAITGQSFAIIERYLAKLNGSSYARRLATGPREEPTK